MEATQSIDVGGKIIPSSERDTIESSIYDSQHITLASIHMDTHRYVTSKLRGATIQTVDESLYKMAIDYLPVGG